MSVSERRYFLRNSARIKILSSKLTTPAKFLSLYHKKTHVTRFALGEATTVSLSKTVSRYVGGGR